MLFILSIMLKEVRLNFLKLFTLYIDNFRYEEYNLILALNST